MFHIIQIRMVSQTVYNIDILAFCFILFGSLSATMNEFSRKFAKVLARPFHFAHTILNRIKKRGKVIKESPGRKNRKLAIYESIAIIQIKEAERKF